MIYLNVEAVSVILKEGSSVSIKVGSGIWNRNIVYKSRGNTVYIALPDGYPEEKLTTGSAVCLKYVNDYFIYLFEGTVSFISADEPAYASVRISSAEEIINTRLSPRYDVCLAADLRPVWDDTCYTATIMDISFGGAAFICAHRFDHNEELNTRIHLPDGKNVLAAGKIVRRGVTGTASDYSMRFIELDEDNCNHLSRYFLVIENEISLMHNNYISNIIHRLTSIK